jgi:hypothetical protein
MDQVHEMKSIENLTDEEKVILLFMLLGEKVAPWSEPQQVAYLLGILQCPEGHVLAGESAELSTEIKARQKWSVSVYEVFPDIIFKQFIDSDGCMLPNDSGEETREFSESSKWTVLTCGNKHHEHSPWFYVPPAVLEDLKKILPFS